MATTLNNLGLLHSDNDRYEEAEEELKEALGIRLELAKAYHVAYRPAVADTLIGLGVLHYYNNRYEEAEKKLKKALEIYEEFAEIAPAVFQPKVEIVQNCLDELKGRSSD